jgi:hypothetical protein
MHNNLGVEDLSLQELDELFNDDGTQETPPVTETVQPETSTGESQQDDTKKEDTTKAFAKRLKESTEKAINAEREAIAKSMGYASYSEMQQKRERELMEKEGLDPEQVAPVVEELVKQRLNNDPRMKELELLRRQQIEEFGKKELAEITKLTGGEITSLAQLSPEVKAAWAKKGSLTAAYMELEGANLVRGIRSEQSKGSTSHLNNPSGGTNVPSGERHLTEEEKQYWRVFHPHMTEEELNKKTVKK